MFQPAHLGHKGHQERDVQHGGDGHGQIVQMEPAMLEHQPTEQPQDAGERHHPDRMPGKDELRGGQRQGSQLAQRDRPGLHCPQHVPIRLRIAETRIAQQHHRHDHSGQGIHLPLHGLRRLPEFKNRDEGGGQCHQHQDERRRKQCRHQQYRPNHAADDTLSHDSTPPNLRFLPAKACRASLR